MVKARAGNATIVRQGDCLKVGKDLADAVTGKLAAHGEVQVGVDGKRLTWVSTLPIIDAEHVIRRSAEKEGKRVVYFMSQAIAV